MLLRSGNPIDSRLFRRPAIGRVELDDCPLSKRWRGARQYARKVDATAAKLTNSYPPTRLTTSLSLEVHDVDQSDTRNRRRDRAPCW